MELNMLRPNAPAQVNSIPALAPTTNPAPAPAPDKAEPPVDWLELYEAALVKYYMHTSVGSQHKKGSRWRHLGGW